LKIFEAQNQIVELVCHELITSSRNYFHSSKKIKLQLNFKLTKWILYTFLFYRARYFKSTSNSIFAECCRRSNHAIDILLFTSTWI